MSLSFLRLTTLSFFFFFFNDTATTEIYTLSLHDALPIYLAAAFHELNAWERAGADASSAGMVDAGFENQKELTKMQLDNQKEIAEMQNETQKEIAGIQSATSRQQSLLDRKSGSAGMPRPISYAVFCLKKKKKQKSRS